MVSVRRLADDRHQVLEISPPVAMEGGTAAAFGRCVAAMDAAITANPVDWNLRYELDDLVSLGLLPSAAQQAAMAGGHTD